MKTKRILHSLICCALAFVLLSSAACADSLIDHLPKPSPSPTPQSSVAPSYGDFANVMVDEETVNEYGEAVITYNNVSAQQMQDFGVVLKQQGYVVEVEEEQDGVKAYQLSNNVFSFILIYNMAEQSLITVYPKGTEYATSLFPGYTKVYLGDTFKIKDLGEFTFDSIELGEFSNFWYDNAGNGMMIVFDYYNTSANTQDFYKYTGQYDVSEDMLFKGVFCYKNSDEIYTYKCSIAGNYMHRGLLYGLSFVDSLETSHLAICFDLPTGVRNSTDGTFAMTMDFPNGEKYVLMLRENGVNLF